jgi:hypothetical protein
MVYRLTVLSRLSNTKGGMQRSECMSIKWSRFLPHRSRNSNISALFPHFIHTRSPFHPQNRGKMVEFSNVFFVPDVRMNGASFAPNRMFIPRMVWPQLKIVTDLLTDLLTFNTLTALADHSH